MKTGGAILAGLLAGVLVAAGVFVALVFVGPDPIGLRPTPSPTVAATASPSASAGPSASPAQSASASAGAPTGSDAGQTGFRIWIDKDGIVRYGALGGIGADVMASSLSKVLRE